MEEQNVQDGGQQQQELLEELAAMRQRIVELEAMLTNRQPNRELVLLNRMGQEFTTTLDLQHITEELLSAATEIIGTEGASIWVWEGEGMAEDWLVCRAAYHHQNRKPLPTNLRLRLGEGIAGWVALQGERVMVRNAREDPRFTPDVDAQTGFHTVSLMAVPLWSRDRVIGVLEVVNKLDGEFDQQDGTLADLLAGSAAIALDNARLAADLRRRTVDLQEARVQMDGVAKALAVDLRGPLGIMVSFAQVLEEDYATIEGEELGRYLRAIAQKGRAVVGVIDGLLASLASGSGQSKGVDVSPLDTGRIVEDVLDRLAYMVERYQAEFILPDQWPVALGYGPWVEEVWSNYITNALKYGGRPPRVELGFDEQDGHVRFWVRDNGPGLTPEERVRLFIQPARRDRGRGSDFDLGLALVRRIVEKLGGRVGMEGEEGQGSLFYFTLPVVE